MEDQPEETETEALLDRLTEEPLLDRLLAISKDEQGEGTVTHHENGESTHGVEAGAEEIEITPAPEVDYATLNRIFDGRLAGRHLSDPDLFELAWWHRKLKNMLYLKGPPYEMALRSLQMDIDKIDRMIDFRKAQYLPPPAPIIRDENEEIFEDEVVDDDPEESELESSAATKGGYAFRNYVLENEDDDDVEAVGEAEPDPIANEAEIEAVPPELESDPAPARPGGGYDFRQS